MASKKMPRAPRLVLEVNDDILDFAIGRDSAHCVWAEAIRVAYPDAANVSIDVQTMRFSDLKKGYRYTYLTPRVAQVAIISWDVGQRPPAHKITLRGGQVSIAGRRTSRSGKPLSEAALKQRRTASKKSVEAKLSTSRMVKRGGGDVVPDKVGGKPPPLVPGGRRREFGIRGLTR